MSAPDDPSELHRRFDQLEAALREQWAATSAAVGRVDGRLDALEGGLREAWATVSSSIHELQASAGTPAEGPRWQAPPMRVRLDLATADHDTEPPRDPVPPQRPYLVCSTPRSGSTLLCRGLAAAGVAGVPLEYFNALLRDPLSARWGVDSVDAYVRALYSRRTTHAGVFGAKAHWDQLSALRAELLGLSAGEPAFAISSDFLGDVLPGVRYVRISRLDVDRQAVSFWKALRSGLFSEHAAAAPEPTDVPYSFEGIDRCRRLIENGELHWDRFFAANGIEPLRVTYEDLAGAYVETIEQVVRWLVPDAGDFPVPPPTSRRLADERSAAMVERFLDERQTRGLPDPLRAPL
jgi:trehalose 2-sulfotransferase